MSAPRLIVLAGLAGAFAASFPADAQAARTTDTVRPAVVISADLRGVDLSECAITSKISSLGIDTPRHVVAQVGSRADLVKRREEILSGRGDPSRPIEEQLREIDLLLSGAQDTAPVTKPKPQPKPPGPVTTPPFKPKPPPPPASIK
jgi:hypothetical protein